MIANPVSPLEHLQNELAAKLMTRPLFTGLTMPDGSDFKVLTEDEGDPEFLYEEMLSRCGLSIVVQCPTGKIVNAEENPAVLNFNPMVIGVTISEAVLFNREEAGTKVRLMTATWEVFTPLHGFESTVLQEKIFATRIFKDRDTLPKTGELVASRIIAFEAAELFLPIST